MELTEKGQKNFKIDQWKLFKLRAREKNILIEKTIRASENIR